MYGVIYKITNLINGKSYVGQTSRTLKERFIEHAKAKTHLGNAIRKYGRKNFSVEVIEECTKPEQLNEREIFWIAHFNCKHPNGYNFTDGGEGTGGWKASPETRANMSVAQKKFFQEHPEACAARSERLKGHLVSDKTRAKISVANQNPSSETRAKIVLTSTGRKHSAETLAKMSASHKGKKLTSEQRARQSAAASARGNRFIAQCSVYPNLTAELAKRQITFSKLAEYLGLTLQVVSEKVRGKREIYPAQMEAIKKILGVEISVEELFSRRE